MDFADAGRERACVPLLASPRDRIRLLKRGERFGVAAMVVECLAERKTERYQIILAGAALGERSAQSIDVRGVELRRLEIGESPPRHAGVGLLGDDAAVF